MVDLDPSWRRHQMQSAEDINVAAVSTDLSAVCLCHYVS